MAPKLMVICKMLRMTMATPILLLLLALQLWCIKWAACVDVANVVDVDTTTSSSSSNLSSSTTTGNHNGTTSMHSTNVTIVWSNKTANWNGSTTSTGNVTASSKALLTIFGHELGLLHVIIMGLVAIAVVLLLVLLCFCCCCRKKRGDGCDGDSDGTSRSSKSSQSSHYSRHSTGATTANKHHHRAAKHPHPHHHARRGQTGDVKKEAAPPRVKPIPPPPPVVEEQSQPPPPPVQKRRKVSVSQQALLETEFQAQKVLVSPTRQAIIAKHREEVQAAKAAPMALKIGPLIPLGTGGMVESGTKPRTPIPWFTSAVASGGAGAVPPKQQVGPLISNTTAASKNSDYITSMYGNKVMPYK